MEKIKWSAEYNIGIEPIDTQHQKLVEILNNLNEIKKEKDMESLIRVFHDLICYSRIHFFDEEEIMKKISYPKYEEHKEEHKFFIDKLEEINKEIYEKNVYISLSMRIFLTDWLVGHILKTDRGLIPYINK